MAYIKHRTRDFYFYALFGVPYDEARKLGEQEQIILCAHRAYGDLSRTINYLMSFSELEKKKKTQEAEDFLAQKSAFKQGVRNCLSQRISELLNGTIRESFDCWHDGICKKIIEMAASYSGLVESFSYGQAQKWVNMTLKYMDISGFWDQNESFCQLRKQIHVPVDSYILKAASESNILLPRANGKGYGAYSESGTKKWSNWEEADYKAFIGIDQAGDNNLRKAISNLPEWEDEKWIQIAWKNSAMNPVNQK